MNFHECLYTHRALIWDPTWTEIIIIVILNSVFLSLQSLESLQMVSNAENPHRDLLQATLALKFIQLQLVELAKDCGNTVQKGLFSFQYFLELQNKLEKLLHEVSVFIF